MKRQVTDTTNKSQRPFFLAVLDSVRMLDEHSEYFFNSMQNVFDGKLKYKAANEVTYNTGVDDPDSPEGLQIVINFSLSIEEEPSGVAIAEYHATHEARYTITYKDGAINWFDMDEEDLAVYFSSLFTIAKTRAESALSAMGLSAITLRNQDFTKTPEKVMVDIKKSTKRLKQ